MAISAIDMGNLEECRVYMNITEQLVKPNTEEWMSLQALKTDYLFETHQYKALISLQTCHKDEPVSGYKAGHKNKYV